MVPGLNVQFNVTRATAIVAASDSGLSHVHTVPDPYYVTNAFETSTSDKIIRFVNLPAKPSSGSTRRAACWSEC